MPRFPDLKGTLYSFFQLGIGGAVVRSNLGAIEARNAANSGYAPMRCSSLVLSTPLSGLYGGTPAGVVLPYAAAASPIPDGYLICDGSAVSRTDYAILFDAIGTTYGVGNGSTTFNVPNLKGRVPLGAGVSAASGTNRALGATGGEDAHTMTTAELASHAHSGVVVGSQAASGYMGGVSLNLQTGSSASTGSATPFNVLQPYIALNYIIKT